MKPATVYTLLVLCFPLLAAAEVSVIQAADGVPVHWLKLTDPEQGRIWAVMTHASRNVSSLNPSGDDRGDLEPVVFMGLPAGPGKVAGLPGRTLGFATAEGGPAPTTPSRIGVPEPSDFDIDDYIVLAPGTTVASYAIPAPGRTFLIALWPAATPDGYRLVWSRWDATAQRWSPPSRVTTVSVPCDETTPMLRLSSQGRLLASWREDASRTSFWEASWAGKSWSMPAPIWLDKDADGTPGTP